MTVPSCASSINLWRLRELSASTWACVPMARFRSRRSHPATHREVVMPGEESVEARCRAGIFRANRNVLLTRRTYALVHLQRIRDYPRVFSTPSDRRGAEARDRCSITGRPWSSRWILFRSTTSSTSPTCASATCRWMRWRTPSWAVNWNSTGCLRPDSGTARRCGLRVGSVQRVVDTRSRTRFAVRSAALGDAAADALTAARDRVRRAVHAGSRSVPRRLVGSRSSDTRAPALERQRQPRAAFEFLTAHSPAGKAGNQHRAQIHVCLDRRRVDGGVEASRNPGRSSTRCCVVKGTTRATSPTPILPACSAVLANAYSDEAIQVHRGAAQSGDPTLRLTSDDSRAVV